MGGEGSVKWIDAELKRRKLRMFAGGVDCAVPKDAEGCSLYYRAADIKTRLFLIAVGERLCDEGKTEAAAILLHADLYLSDRLAYELDRAGVIERHHRTARLIDALQKGQQG